MERELTAREKEIGGRFGRRWAKMPERVRQGEAVRNQVKVNTAAPGIVHTRIQRPPEGTQLVGERPGEIMQHMAVGDTYDRLRVKQGSGNGGVKVLPPPSHNQNRTESVSKLADGLRANTAVINGGFFGPDPQNNDYAKPVGPTKDREDSLPIQKAYHGDYHTLNVGDKAGISSGPILEPSKETFEDARFKRENKDKPEYCEPGSLVHADKNNPRAAISIFPPKKVPGFPPRKKVPGDVIMHTLTTGDATRGTTDHGATMKEWQDITTQGSYQYKPSKKGKEKEKIKEREKRPSTLNLDGGMSVDMGITRGNGHTDRIASERQNPAEVPNIIFAGGDQQENKGKEISIEDPNKKSKMSGLKFWKP